MTRRVLIITGGPLCRNPRVVKEATTLGRAGYAVTVLHVRHHAPSEALDVELLQAAPFRRQVVDLLTPGASRFVARSSIWMARKSSKWGLRSVHTLGPVGALWRAARAERADLTIVHNEPAHAVGLRLHAEGRRVCADIEDWHSEDLLPADRRSRPLPLLVRQERELLNLLPHTTTTSHALADALHVSFGGHRPHVITNSFPLQPNPRTGATDVNDRSPPAFLWFSQTLGPGRGLEPFLAAWSRTRHPSRVVLLGQPHGAFREALLSLVPPERRARVAFLDCVAPRMLPEVVARHDIGLALEDGSIRSRDLTITNKILQYLNAGLAVVASATAGQREVLAHDPTAGVIVDSSNVGGYAHSLDALLANRAALASRQRAARRLAENVYCWEREEPRLLALAASALAR